MKRLVVAVVCIMLTGSSGATSARVGYIVDGDTFAANVLLQDGVEITVRVRLRNVDTPELHGACIDEIIRANMARDRLAELLPVGSVIDLQNIKDDKYLGRIDANVILSDGRDVGNILVREKFGRSYNGGRRVGWCN